MGVSDELLREKQVISNNGTYIQPEQITASELGELGITAEDIADASLTAVKFNTTCRDATKGLTGLGASVLSLVPDGTLVEFDAGGAGAKKIRIKDDACGVTQLEALAAGGLTGGAGSAWAVAPDNIGLELNANKLRVKDLGVTVDKFPAQAQGGLTGGAGSALAVNPDGVGFEISGGKLALKNLGTTHARLNADANLRRFSVPLTIQTAPGSVTDAIMTCPSDKSYYITKISVAAQTVCSDANGTVTADVIKYDSSGTADVNVVTGADCELAAAKVAEDWTVITAASANVMDEGDTLRVVATGNDEGADGLDASQVAGVLTVEYYEVI